MITVLVVLVVGVLLYLVVTFVPMHPVIRGILVALVVVALGIWVLQVTGLLAAAGLQLPRGVRLP